MSWFDKINQELNLKKQQDVYRSRTVRSAVYEGAHIRVDDQKYLNFSSNDYLGYSQHPSLVAAAQEHIQHFGLGSTGSPLLAGHTDVHAQLETELARWQGFERALLFNSGFAANQALIYALLGKNDRILADKLSHASLLEAAMHSPASLQRFQHNQPDSLQKLLNMECMGETLVATEGVFSMDGDQAPLLALQKLANDNRALFVVDDAHGLGVLGAEGKGTCAAQGMRPDILVLAFGKAMGLSGAAILCSHDVAEFLIQSARHYVYSTAMPAFQAASLNSALSLLRQDNGVQCRLQQNIAYFKTCFAAANVPLTLLPSDTAIQPVVIGKSLDALNMANALRQQGLWLSAIRTPTVPMGQSRLRLTLTALHSKNDIETLIQGLQYVSRRAIQ